MGSVERDQKIQELHEWQVFHSGMFAGQAVRMENMEARIETLENHVLTLLADLAERESRG